MLKTIDIYKTRDIYIDKLLSIDTLHNAYHNLADKLSKESGCNLYLLDASISTKLHYMSPHRDKIESLFKTLLKYDFYFSIIYKNKKEIFYSTDKFSLKNTDYDAISALKIYVRIYANTTGFMIFASRVSLVIDFWREDNNIYISNIYTDIATMIASSQFLNSISSIIINNQSMLCLKAYKEVHTYYLNNPIDIVYTWVDDTDKKWLKKMQDTLINYKGYLPKSSTDKARFISNNELLYSLRSIITYLKGINKIYIVTDEQIPPFLSTRDTRIKIIDHKEIFEDNNYLPSFNSNSIASQVNNIKGLSKRYLFFNDDMFIGRSNTMNLFFDTYGHGKCFYSNYTSIPPTINDKAYSPVDNAAINNRDILKNKYGFSIFKKFQHTPVPVQIDVIKNMEQEFPDIMKDTACHPFRSNDEYSVGAFYCHYGLIKGVIYPSSLRYSYILLGGKDFNTKVERLLSKKESKRYDVICVNSETTTGTYKNNSKEFQKIFSSYFPLAGDWEKKRTTKTNIA